MKHFPQQIAVKEKLRKYKVGAFFMEPGTGKTRPVVELIREQNPDYVLYVAPYQAIHTKNKKESVVYQVKLWGGFDCEHDFIGVESIGLSGRIFLEIYEKMNNYNKIVMVVDESLKIKNADAKRTKRIIELGKLAGIKYILNGTPFSRNMLDLWSQMDFLSSDILKMGLAEYKDSFCEYKKHTIHRGNSKRSREWIVSYHNLDYLYELIRPYVFESKLRLNVSLQEIPIYYNLSRAEKKEHTRILDEILSEEWLLAKPNFFLELTQKLQNNYSRNEEKFSITEEILADNPDTLIVAKYIETQEELSRRFPDARILSWQKNAFALNLQEYNKMLLFDQHWDYGLFDQIIKRIFRKGQLRDCVVWRLVGDCGLEKRMWENVDKKANLLQKFKRLTRKDLIKQIA